MKPEEFTTEQWIDIENAIYAGRKIEAIKLFREASGADLKDSKELIEEHEASLHEQSPDKFVQKKGGGCMTVLCVTLPTLASIFYLL